jgi:hypothetical protein
MVQALILLALMSAWTIHPQSLVLVSLIATSFVKKGGALCRIDGVPVQVLGLAWCSSATKAGSPSRYMRRV